MVWEEIDAPSYSSVSGKEAKEEIAQATLQAVTVGQLFWLSQNGMQAGVGLISPLAFINGFLASFLQPIISDIPDDENYTRESLDTCVGDIKGKGTLIYAAILDQAPATGAIAGSVREAVIIPKLASCDLNQTGKILYIAPIINY